MLRVIYGMKLVYDVVALLKNYTIEDFLKIIIIIFYLDTN